MPAKQILIAVDQLFNTLLGGWADETLSSRAWRWYLNGQRKWPKHLINGLFFWQKNHCYHAYQSEKDRLHSPPETRTPNTGA